MSSQWYKPVKDKIGPLKAIKNRESDELALVGRYGEIWVYSETEIGVVITSPRIASANLPESKHPIQKGDEVQFRAPIHEVVKWAKIIGVNSNRNGMIKKAENF